MGNPAARRLRGRMRRGRTPPGVTVRERTGCVGRSPEHAARTAGSARGAWRSTPSRRLPRHRLLRQRRSTWSPVLPGRLARQGQPGRWAFKDLPDRLGRPGRWDPPGRKARRGRLERTGPLGLRAPPGSRGSQALTGLQVWTEPPVPTGRLGPRAFKVWLGRRVHKGPRVHRARRERRERLERLGRPGLPARKAHLALRDRKGQQGHRARRDRKVRPGRRGPPVRQERRAAPRCSAPVTRTCPRA
jgi:hypothetical protein